MSTKGESEGEIVYNVSERGIERSLSQSRDVMNYPAAG